jgi:hypothetical protein
VHFIQKLSFEQKQKRMFLKNFKLDEILLTKTEIFKINKKCHKTNYEIID